MANHSAKDPKIIKFTTATRGLFVSWAIGVLAIWMLLTIVKKEMQPLDDSIIYVLGILMTGKVGQRFAEDK